MASILVESFNLWFPEAVWNEIPLFIPINEAKLLLEFVLRKTIYEHWFDILVLEIKHLMNALL